MLSILRSLFADRGNGHRRLPSVNVRASVERLEGREMLTAVSMTAYDQLLLELINRARQDPWAEVARNPLVNDLNQGLAAGTISSLPKQPLAAVQALVDAGKAHAQDMLDKDYFSHYSEPGGESPTDRAAAQGYTRSVNENIAWSGSTTAIDQEAEVKKAHEMLFASAVHRQNLLAEAAEEAGTGVRFGVFSDGPNSFHAVMLAEEFGSHSGTPFLTGVAYDDAQLDDDFYSVGEGESGIRVTAINTSTAASFWTLTGPSGGYNLQLPVGTYTVTARGGTLDAPMVITDVVIGSVNVKIDFDTSTSPQSVQGLVGFNSRQEFWVGASNGTKLQTKYYGKMPSATTYDYVGTGDFNGDGLADVAVRAASDGSLVIALSTGQSSFATAKWGIFSTVQTWTKIVIGDFNGDGLDDILGRADGDGTFWLAKSNGSRFITTHWGGLSTAVAWTELVTADVNGDGNSDVVARAADGNWWASISNGKDRLLNSYWGRWSTSVVWTDVRVGDFDGDGLDDVVGRANNGDWWVNRSSGAGFFFVEHLVKWNPTVNWLDVTVGDFDGDGKDEIAGRANGRWWLSMSLGTATGYSSFFWGSWTTSTPWSDVSLIDINGDGKDDLIGRTGNGQWWLLQSNGSSFSHTLVATWSKEVMWSHVGVGKFT